MYFNLIKSLIIASFIFFNSVIFAQEFGLTPKLIKNIEGSYTAYTSV